MQVWPALPFLGLGLWLAWPFLAYSGGVWLSDIEVNGENISRLFITSSAGLAAVSLLAAFFYRSFRRFIENRGFVIGLGLIGCLGAAAIILGGPYYFGHLMPFNPNPPFIIGAFLTGVSSGALLLRCGLLYSQLPPRRALLYTALSHLLLAVIFFVVHGLPYWRPLAGGPSLAGIIVFVTLLPLAGLVLSLQPPAPAAAQPLSAAGSERPTDAAAAGGERPTAVTAARCESAPEHYDLTFHQLPAVFWKFIVMLLLFSMVVSMIRSVITNIHPVDVTLSSSNILMLLRIAMALVFVFIALSPRASRLNYGKLFSLVAIAIVVTMALLPSFGVLDVNLNLVISMASVVFEYIFWCILAIVAHQKQISPVIIFGFGYGSYMLGNASGWFIGIFGLTQIINGPFISIFYLLLAGMVLIITLILFSERDFERLFSPISESELTLEYLMRIDVTTQDATQPGAAHKRGHFSQTMERLALEKGLSPRESEVLRYLAMGRGSDFIAEQLSVSWNTARTHIHNVYVKLDVHSRKELMDYVDHAVNPDK
ncbi:MAG: helix-turn-helix transcriptional regulator [Coriobacteriales bacterium]|nr:helix-turn-helix transcriptional regulator [Coriobacteriales bacterium]